jgi:hypothetical protein
MSRTRGFGADDHRGYRPFVYMYINLRRGGKRRASYKGSDYKGHKSPLVQMFFHLFDF